MSFQDCSGRGGGSCPARPVPGTHALSPTVALPLAPSLVWGKAGSLTSTDQTGMSPSSHRSFLRRSRTKSSRPTIKIWVGSVCERQKNQRSNCQHPLDHRKSKSSRKTSTSLLTTSNLLTVLITTNWKILKETGILDHLTCLLRNLYAGQEATVRTGHETTDRFQIRKGVHQGCILSSCLFNFYAEYNM